MLAPWKKSYDELRQHIKKQRHHFANKCPYSQSYGFSSSHLWMWELDHKEGCCSSVPQSCPTFCNLWTAARQASLSITNFRSLLKLMSIELVMPSNHLILCRPLLLPPLIFPSIRVFPRSQVFASGGQSIGVSASSSILLMNIQDWFPLGWTGWISLQVQGTLKSLLQHHSSKASILQHSSFFIVQLSHP